MQSSKDLTLDEYVEKTYYCRDCHSIYILKDTHLEDDNWDGSYCGKCYSTNIGECCFGEWLVDEEKRRNDVQYIEI